MTIDDPWADEGFAGEDDWGEESLASDLEEEVVELEERRDGEASVGEADEEREGSVSDGLR